MSPKVPSLALLLTALLASPAVAQTTIRVPADQPTIQAGIGAAAPGDTVLVAPGTYVERISFLGKAITVASEAGPAGTVIDGNGTGVVATFNSGEGRTATLRGFTLTNGGGFSGGGVAVSNASPTIDGNVITGNAGCDGIGINVSFGSPLIVGNEITGNVRSGCSGGVGGAGIKVTGASAAVIEANVIADNSLTGGNGGGISLFAAGAPVIRNNVIARNSVSGVSPAARGGGIWIVNQSDALIVQNLIVGNSAGEGGGIYWLVPSGARGPRVVNNTIADNLATVAGLGSGVFADGFDVNAALVNNVLVGSPGQTALHCGNFNDANPPVVQFNDVFTPGGGSYGGLCVDQTGVNGNVSVDPAFVAPGAGDYRLQIGSPVIDAGNSAAADVPATDLDGNPRVVDGNGDTVAVVDLGAYERLSGPVSRVAAMDSILAPSSKNLNDGANAVLVVDTHRSVVAFDLTGASAAGLSRVTLRLTLAEPATSWGKGRLVSVHRLAVPFAEGNGRWFDLPPSGRTRGNGPGVTWNCATDSAISNSVADCGALWNGGSTAAGPVSASVLHTNGLTGTVEWDVTADVLQALSESATSVQWLIRRAVENQNGQAIYHSKDGAAALGNLDLAPILTFEF
ncbi:MAG: right-handed parallel beta-helix repeat-containing protein [Candidatus Rokuibacteriota bacterium]